MGAINRYWALVLSALLAVAVATGCGAPSSDGGGAEKNFTTKLQFGTGSVGGVYYPLGQEYANLFEKNIDVEGLSVSAVETGASVENLAKISRGKLQLGLAQNNTALQAVQGKGEFEDAQIDNAGFMGQLYPEAAQIITLESTGIDSVADLKGKTVAIGPPGSGTRSAAVAILEAYGIEKGDYKPLKEGFEDAKTKIQDGNADASIEVLGVPGSSLEELQATTNEVKLVPIDDKHLEKVLGNTDYQKYTISPDAYGFLDEPVQTVAAFACLFGSTTQISKDLGYQLTKVVYEHADDVTVPQKKLIKLDEALQGRTNLPLHPGAKKYFKEEGLL